MKKSDLPGIKVHKSVKEALRDLNKQTVAKHNEYIKQLDKGKADGKVHTGI